MESLGSLMTVWTVEERNFPKAAAAAGAAAPAVPSPIETQTNSSSVEIDEGEEPLSQSGARHISELDLLMRKRFASFCDGLGGKINSHVEGIMEKTVDMAVGKYAAHMGSTFDAKLAGQKQDMMANIGSLDNRISGAVAAAAASEEKLPSTLGEFRKDLQKFKEHDPKLHSEDTRALTKDLQDTMAKLKQSKKDLGSAAPTTVEKLLRVEMLRLRADMQMREDQSEARKCATFGWESMPHQDGMKLIHEFLAKVPGHEQVIDGYSPYLQDGSISPVLILTFRSVLARQRFVTRLQDKTTGIAAPWEGKTLQIGGRAAVGRTTNAIDRPLTSTPRRTPRRCSASTMGRLGRGSPSNGGTGRSQSMVWWLSRSRWTWRSSSWIRSTRRRGSPAVVPAVPRPRPLLRRSVRGGCGLCCSPAGSCGTALLFLLTVGDLLGRLLRGRRSPEQLCRRMGSTSSSVCGTMGAPASQPWPGWPGRS